MVLNTMRASSTLTSLLLFGVLFSSRAPGQQRSAYELLPAASQAVVWVPDGEQLMARWDRTQLARLAADPAVAPFFDEQRQEIEKRFVDAGWRLNVKPDKIREFLTGQIAVAWLELPEVPRKPFAMVLIADVDDIALKNKQLLDQIDQEMNAQQAVKTELTHAGIGIVKYTLPAKAGELLAQNTFYAIAKGHFLATDDEPLIRDLIGRIQGAAAEADRLTSDKVFLEGRKQLDISGEAQIEYFVRPLGFARVLRSIGGKRSKSSADMLAVLQNQGFEAIRCVCGEILIGQDQLDIVHRGYVLADQPLPLSVAVFDFPNQASREIPKFVGEKISSLLVTHWNASEAFWKTEGLVDELAGTPGVFDEVIDGIKKDPNGPRIDIRQDVLPHFTNDIYAVSDSAEGAATVNSRRNLIALRVKNTEAMAKVVDRAMRNEPDAELVEFEAHPIWKVVHKEDAEIDNLDFGDDFGAPPPAAPGAAGEPWLTDWAITVYDEYLMFASHVEMIQQAIAQAKQSDASPLLDVTDFQRAVDAIAEHFGREAVSAWNVVRTDRAYRVQYELFREGKLNQSQSMLASILDKLLQSDSEIRDREQVVQGKSLPPFEKISHFLQPSAMLVRTTPHGWEFGSLLLAGPDDNEQPSLELSERLEVDTARDYTNNSPKR